MPRGYPERSQFGVQIGRGQTYVVDDQGHGRHVNSTSKNVGGDENLGVTTAESINHGITLRAFDTTGQRRDGVAFGNHALLDLHSGVTGLGMSVQKRDERTESTDPDEDNGRSDSEKPVELHQVAILFIVVVTIHVELFDTLDRQLLVLEGNFVRVRSELARIAVDVGRKSGGEENDLNGSGKHAESAIS